jgi:AraC-like DNA-binding protein
MFNLTIEEYARIAGRSVASFKREFNEHYGTSPGKWLTHKRLEQAKLYLVTSKKTIGEIIYDTGFENISHFSRIFKENYGLSPMQYRQNNPVMAMAQ